MLFIDMIFNIRIVRYLIRMYLLFIWNWFFLVICKIDFVNFRFKVLDLEWK